MEGEIEIDEKMENKKCKEIEKDSGDMEMERELGECNKDREREKGGELKRQREIERRMERSKEK